MRSISTMAPFRRTFANPQPDFNLTTELKNVKDGKKADGAILKGETALAVIELKGTDTTDLGRVESQAFGYKNNQPGCTYVVTSNFEKLRFYIDNAVDVEEFHRFELTREKFEILWLCLAAESLLAGVPRKIKEESLTQEEQVTKKLYKDYSSFRAAVFQNISEANPQYDKLLLFKKTQKLLDRFLFIFFAEDRLLLPPNSIRNILQQWLDLKDKYDEYFPLYDRFKKYFSYLNTGHRGKEHDIFAYNGGLFAPDEILDSISIDDTLLFEHTQNLSNYDFESEVSVNILGHIFEHSLTEIETIQAELEGAEIDKSKTKRKKDGVFYTPKYITKYIVENTVGKLCEEKKAELEITDEAYQPAKQRSRKRLQNLQDYRDWLLQLTICDPACGSGAFLNQALEFLIAEHRYIDELSAKYNKDALVLSDVENAILENNLFGVDINEESVEIAKLSLWLRTAQRGRKLTSLNDNIKCGNSLIDDPEVAGEKALNWVQEFPEVFEKGGFDVVIGNPPYVFAREKINEKDKLFYANTYKSAQYQVNTYLLFIERSIEIIKDAAIYGLIVPNAWLMVYSGQELRKYILDTCIIEEIINLAGYSFEGVNVETIILISRKQTIGKDQLKVLLSQGMEFKYSHSRSQQDFEENDGFEFRVFADQDSLIITNKLRVNSNNLDELVQIKAGLQAYEKNKGNPKQTSEDVKNRPYDFDFKFDDKTFKYLEGKNVGRYCIEWTGLYLRYGEHLASPRTFDLFNDPKIIVREITGKFPQSIIASYTEELYLYNRSNIGIIEREKSPVGLKYVLALLNSKLISYYFMKNTAKSVRKMFPKIILNDLRLFPIKVVGVDIQKEFERKVDKIQNSNLQLVQFRNQLIDLLQSKFPLESPSNKLQSWFDLTFKGFLKELNKSKVQLSLSEEAEWMMYFKEQKQKIQDLKSEIIRINAEIDQMVYELYGLPEEEIQIVENS